MRQMVGGSAALVLAGALIATCNAAGPEKLVTSVALNLRSQPILSSSVLLVIPAGGLVGYQEVEQNGFTKVSYAGSIGWAKSEYLSPASGGGGWQGNPNNAAYRGQATTSAAVNMRNGGGMNYGVKLVIPAGAVVDVYDDYANCFWLVNYNGEFGWVHDDFLVMDYDEGADMPAYTGMGTTTATVNLRAGAGTRYQVIAVVPAGASIELYAGPAGSWGRVRYNGQFGYIHSDYIASSL
jgi:uncharacterized protein YraI